MMNQKAVNKYKIIKNYNNLLSIEENEEEEKEEEEEKKEEKKEDKKKFRNKEQIKIERNIKDADKDDINTGSFITQPPFKKNINNNGNTKDNKDSSNIKIKKIPYNNNNSSSNLNLNSDKKSAITVAIRVRPLNQNELEITPVEGIKIINSNSLIVTSDPNSTNRKTNLIKEHQFFFDYVFGPSATQEEIYQNTTQKLLPGIIEGFNATVFAYGATGSGKTYTMLGTINKEGIMTRSIRDLFQLVNHLCFEKKSLFVKNFKLSSFSLSTSSGSTSSIISQDCPSFTPVGFFLFTVSLYLHKGQDSFFLIHAFIHSLQKK